MAINNNPVPVQLNNTIFDIEQKQNSQEMLDYANANPTKFFLFANEFNDVARKALEAAVHNVKLDFSWSNKPEHRFYEPTAPTYTKQLLIMDFKDKWVLDAADEVTLLIDRYKPKRKVRGVRTTPQTYKVFLTGFVDVKPIISVLVKFLGISEFDAYNLIQTLPVLVATFTNDLMYQDFVIEMRRANGICTVEEVKPENLPQQHKHSGYKHEVMNDRKKAMRPNEIVITNHKMVLDFGQQFYFAPYNSSYIEPNNSKSRQLESRAKAGVHESLELEPASIKTSGIHRNKVPGKSRGWVYLQFRIKVKRGIDVFYSNPKATIKMMCRRDHYDNVLVSFGLK